MKKHSLRITENDWLGMGYKFSLPECENDKWYEISVKVKFITGGFLADNLSVIEVKEK